MIKINNLKKFFNNECILDGIDLHIRNDEFVVLLGASGSGKSTLLKILSGYESFEQGSIIVKKSQATKAAKSSLSNILFCRG